MASTKLVTLGLCALIAACGNRNPSDGDAASPAPKLEIEPANLTVTVRNGAAVMQPYQAHLLNPDGTTVDVTDSTNFAFEQGAFGSFVANTATISGAAGGVGLIVGTRNGFEAKVNITVNVDSERLEPGAPADCFTRYAAATADTTNPPQLAYPADGVIVPPNIGSFEVHWRAGHEAQVVKLSNQFINLRICKAGGGDQWTAFGAGEWSALSRTQAPFEIEIAGLDAAAPTTKYVAPTRHASVTNSGVRGGIYYWSSTQEAIMRYDMARPNVPVAQFTPSNPHGSCIGCHVLSRDGKKLAGNYRRESIGVTANPANGLETNGAYFAFASFNAAATKLALVAGGDRFDLVEADSGTPIAQIPTTPGLYITHPEFSFDGTQLAYVEYPANDSAFPSQGSIMIRSFDDATNTFGTPRTLVANAAGAANFYPAFSPDGKWVLFTRTDYAGYDQPTAKSWIVPADGSSAPIELAAANSTGNLTDSWPRWLPFATTYGPNNEPMYFLSFSSKREFGVKIPAAANRPQIWMSAFFPSRATAGQDPSTPAFWFPFQIMEHGNHIAQWAEAVVVE